SVIGVLYGVNTLGAAAGALFSTWVLLPRLGLEQSLHVGVWLNVACAGSIMAPALLTTRPAMPPVPTADYSTAPGSTGAFAFATWAVIFACSGLLALSLEIVWFRLFSVMLKS